MTYKTLILAAAMVGFAGVAFADADTDFVFFDAQIAALQHRVDASSSSANPEALTAMRGKQQELANQEAKLKAAGTMTPDEKTALALSIRQQQQRIGSLTQASMPAMKHVDPASVPAPTYVTPLGTTVNAAPGTTPAQNGVIPLQTPVVPAPAVPVIHAPMPAATDAPAQ